MPSAISNVSLLSIVARDALSNTVLSETPPFALNLCTFTSDSYFDNSNNFYCNILDILGIHKSCNIDFVDHRKIDLLRHARTNIPSLSFCQTDTKLVSTIDGSKIKISEFYIF